MKSLYSAFQAIDNYFFCEDEQQLRWWFYGSISFGLIVTLFTLLTTILGGIL